MNTEIQKFMDYLQEQEDIHDIYVLGGQGQYIVDILPDLTSMETTDRVDQVLTLISQNLKAYDKSGQFSIIVFIICLFFGLFCNLNWRNFRA